MADKSADKRPEPKRLNRSVSVADAIAPILGPALRRRGFAGRDIITHWATIAPAPYDEVAAPDRLTWPRNAGRSFEGGTLYLRCLPGHALALQHEGQKIAAAVNRYFGYLLVGEVRLSVEPLIAKTPDAPQLAVLPAAARSQIAAQVEGIADDGVREALQKLGEAVKRRPKPRSGP